MFPTDAHGPLPLLLALLTVSTGLIDAVTVLGLGRVFDANMTGNVVFLGFAVVATPGFAVVASLAALGGFFLGARLGGRLIIARTGHRGRLLRDASAVEVVLVLSAALVLLRVTGPPGTAMSSAAAALLAAGLGLQNAAVRRIGVPDLTTTVLTLTLTGIAADARSSSGYVIGRRAVALLSTFLGAALGALLVQRTSLSWSLVPALALILAVGVTLAVTSRSPAPWHESPR